MKHARLLVILLAACGGGSPKPDTTPPAPPADPIPMTEPAKPEPVVMTPAEPKVEPAEPAPDPMKIKMELLAAENAAFEKARPVFQANCAKCHSKGGGKLAKAKTLEHFEMTAYPFAGHHAMELGKQIRTSLGIDGKKPTMPKDKPGKVKGDDLALIAAWADAFDASHAGGAHEGMDHGSGHGASSGGGEHKH